MPEGGVVQFNVLIIRSSTPTKIPKTPNTKAKTNQGQGRDKALRPRYTEHKAHRTQSRDKNPSLYVPGTANTEQQQGSLHVLGTTNTKQEQGLHKKRNDQISNTVTYTSKEPVADQESKRSGLSKSNKCTLCPTCSNINSNMCQVD